DDDHPGVVTGLSRGIRDVEREANARTDGRRAEDSGRPSDERAPTLGPDHGPCHELAAGCETQRDPRRASPATVELDGGDLRALTDLRAGVPRGGHEQAVER